MRSTKVTTWYSEIECWRHFVTDSQTYNIRCGSQGNFQNPSWASTVWVVLVVSSFARLHKDLSNCENLLICFHLSLCQALATRGVHVTYGGMSRKPVTAATSHMIFKVSSRNDSQWIYSLRPRLLCRWLKVISMFRILSCVVFGWASGMRDRARVKQGLNLHQSFGIDCHPVGDQRHPPFTKVNISFRLSMMEALGQLAKDGALLAPTHKHIGLIKSHWSPNCCWHCCAPDFADYKEALGSTLAGFLPAKYIFKVS